MEPLPAPFELTLAPPDAAEPCREVVASLARLVGDGGAGAGRRARAILRRRSLAELARAEARELVAELGLTPGQAGRLAAGFELGRRARRARAPARPSMRSPARVHAWLAPHLVDAEQETFVVLLLDGKHRLRRACRVSLGTLTTSLVHPREVFRPAIRGAAAALVVAHNHPSGDPEPSAEDVEVTRRLARVGELVGIPLLDHVVLGDGRWVSLRERLPDLGLRA